MEQVSIPVSELRELEGNARIHPESQIKALQGSIAKYGFLVPVVVSPDNTILAGHGRKLAAESLGMTEVPCLVVEEEWTDERKRAYSLVDNRLTEMSIWNMDNLYRELDYLKNFVDLEDFLVGLDMTELAAQAMQNRHEAGDTLNRLIDLEAGDGAFEAAENKQAKLALRQPLRKQIEVECPHCGYWQTVDKG